MQSAELPDLIVRILDRKCGGIVSHLAIWKRSAAKLMGAGTSEANAAKLIKFMRSPRNLDSLVTGLAREGQEVDAFLGGLMSSIDESLYALESWIEAFECVQDSLVQQGRSASPSSIMGYVHCAAEFASHSESSGTLPDLILAMLEEYGFEGEEGCYTGSAE